MFRGAIAFDQCLPWHEDFDEPPHCGHSFADDDELRELMGSSDGKLLRADPDHFLFKSASKTAIVVAGAGAPRIHWAGASWLLARAVNIEALFKLKPAFLFRPAFLAQVLADLQEDGGLVMGQALDEGELAVRIVKAARSMPIIKAALADVIELDALGTGTWIDSAEIANYVGADNTGRVYAQYHSAMGFFCSPADLAPAKQIRFLHPCETGYSKSHPISHFQKDEPVIF